MSDRPPGNLHPDSNQDLDTVTAKRSGRALYITSIIIGVLICAYYGATASVADPMHLFEGMVILALAMLPGLLWAKGGGRQLPMFEVLMLTSASTYALPLLSGRESLRLYPSSLVTYAALTVIAFQATAEMTYYSLKILPGRGPIYSREVIISEINRYIGYGLWLTTAYTYVSIYTTWIPYDLNSVLRAVFSGIGLLAVFVQSRRWGLGVIGNHEKMPFIVNLLLQVILKSSTLFLVDAIAMLLIALFGYIAGSRRLPILAMSIALFALGVLHNGKSLMRERYWDIEGEGRHYQPALSELPGFFSEWVECSANTVPGQSEDLHPTSKLLERASLLHLLCMVEHVTPEKKPFLDGATYATLYAQFVPRFFWPGKPSGHAATTQMSVYYGLQRVEDTVRTTIGFGMVVEAYVNFGLPGIVFLGFLLGAAYKFVHGRTKHSPIMSYAGLFTVVLIAWSIQTEMPLSMWLSSMFQGCVGVLGVPFLIRHVFG
jgi:hypothetical protein